ncbi:MAG: hypothetical protein ACI8PP_001404 [Candidatus Pseudothioglobus sp.]|jgi:hypothetical protein
MNDKPKAASKTGENDFCKINSAYLRGAAGYMLVADGMRPQTLVAALQEAKSALPVLYTRAKSGDNVERLFSNLALAMLASK